MKKLSIVALLFLSVTAPVFGQAFKTYTDPAALSAAGWRAYGPGGLALVQGRQSLLDGKGGWYKWVSGSTASTNSDRTVVCNADSPATGRWIRIADTPMVDAGTMTSAANGTVTQAFVRSFTAAPIVVTTPVGNTVAATNAVSAITTTNFVWRSGSAALVGNWIAILPVP